MSRDADKPIDQRYLDNLDRQNDLAMRRDDLEDMDLAARERKRSYAERLADGFQIIARGES